MSQLSYSWAVWKGLLDINGVVIAEDKSGIPADQVLNKDQVVIALESCTINSTIQEILAGRRTPAKI